MYGEYLKCLISFLVAPIIPSPLAFDGLHNNIIFVVRNLYWKLLKKSQLQSEHKYVTVEGLTIQNHEINNEPQKSVTQVWSCSYSY